MRAAVTNEATQAGIDTSVLVVVRSPILGEGLNKLLSDVGVAAHSVAATREAAPIIDAIVRCDAGLVILDGSLCDGASELVKTLRQQSPGVQIVMITPEDGVTGIADDTIAAVDGILSWEISSEAMIQSLRLIRLGGRVIPPDLLNRLLGVKSANYQPMSATVPSGEVNPTGQAPSPRESQILSYLVVGYPNKTIARQLGITEATVKVHLKYLLRKIKVTNRTQAAIWAVNHGFRAMRPQGLSSIGPVPSPSPGD